MAGRAEKIELEPSPELYLSRVGQLIRLELQMRTSLPHEGIVRDKKGRAIKVTRDEGGRLVKGEEGETIVDLGANFRDYQAPAGTPPDWRWSGDSALYDWAREIWHSLPEDERGGILEFRGKREVLFEEFLNRYSPVIGLFKAHQILGIPEIDEEKPHYGWQIVGLHSLLAAKISEALATVPSVADQLLAEKAAREGLNLLEAEIEDIELWREQAINELVLGVLLQDITKREEVEFKRLAKQEGGKEKQIELIEELVASLETEENKERLQELVADVKKDPGAHAFSAYEALMHEKVVEDIRPVLEQIPALGNIETIIACSRFAGMPVVDYLDAGEEPSLAEIIANLADKFLQDAGLIPDLGTRHQEVTKRYGDTPAMKAKVDKEYKYAAKCAKGLAELMGLGGGEEIPEFVLEKICGQTAAVSLG